MLHFRQESLQMRFGMILRENRRYTSSLRQYTTFVHKLSYSEMLDFEFVREQVRRRTEVNIPIVSSGPPADSGWNCATREVSE